MRNPWPESDPAAMVPADEHAELRQIVRQVLLKYADHEKVRTAADSERGWSPELWRLLNEELEIAGLAVPEEFGGADYGFGELAIVLEEAGAALLPEPLLASAVLGAQALLAADSTDDHRELFEALLRGEMVFTVALQGDEMPRAERDGVSWTVSGVVPRVLQAAAADRLVLCALGDKGPVLLVVDLEEVRVDALTVLDITRRQATVHLDRTPARVLVGPARCAEVLTRLRRLALVAVASEHTGIVARLLESTCEYVAQREQFGRAIGSFQAVKHRLADVLVDLERARSASRYAAAMLDADSEAADLAAAVASAACADAALRTAHEAVQLHGGIGFTWEHFAHYYLRRVLGDEGLFGSSREQRARIADLLGV